MAGKSKGISVNEEAVDQLIDLKQEQVSESSSDHDDDMTGEIIKPGNGLVDSSEMSNIKPGHVRDNVKLVRDSVVATEDKKLNDGTVNLPSKVNTGESMVSVRVKRYARFRYGRNYYEIYPGDVVSIPEGAKENLKKSGHLEVT